ncbi:CaiB/baiF CoA-transferase family protein [Ceratobasidium sp. AG-Ba]|nr:CaiB/baiF CoA-transferase family protein [Ceratobasidium sp. AG-Ba]QRW11887.1 CaiB/baiF CoA-transferase family protein [Ceratobasidium sp. AG-Ba]
MPPNKPLLTTKQIIDKLWSTPALNLPRNATERLILTGPPEPVVPSSFRIGAVAQAAIGCSALSSAYVHQLRHGIDQPQEVSVDARHAVLDCKSEAWATLDGKSPGGTWDVLAGAYKTKDGYVRIHTNFPHHRDIILNTLGLPRTPTPTRETLESSLQQWESQSFEDAVIQAGGCAFKVRSFDEWSNHPHGIHTANLEPLSLRKIGEAPARVLPKAKIDDLPLKGLRVLDLTRVLAGPVCGRTLAAHGADVLWITSPSLPDLPALDVDTSRGKRTTQLDLNNEADITTFRRLLKDADILLQSYRPGSFSRRGFGPDELATQYPNLITASLSGFGLDGPWGGRRAFDSLVQAATGFNIAEAEAYQSARPSEQASPLRPLPCQALDHAAGYLLVLGINAALGRRIKEGGNWHVDVSLLGTANWVRSLGRIDPNDAFNHEAMSYDIPKTSSSSELAPLLVEVPSAKNNTPRLRALRHSAALSLTPVRVGQAPGGLSSHAPEWLPA